ncbi:MAG TPA: PAS domain S-box protein [Gemmatimonadaceae bacterium]|nr:PAS domain S-box protein [Gemmatimonadaceae bacterium]
MTRPAAPPASDDLLAELHRARQALGDRERQMDLIEELAGLGSWEIDLATDAIRWSREQHRIHGVDDAGAPRTHSAFVAMVHPDDRRIIDEGMAALAGGEPVTVEFRVVRPDGQVRLLQARGRLVPDAEGGPGRVLGTSLDITERRATERALRASVESYRTIFQHASDAMWLHDLDTGAFLEVNEAAVEMYGYTAEEQKAIGVAGLSAGVAPYRAEDALHYITRAAAGEPQQFVWLGRHKDGRDVWGEVRLRRVRIDGVDRLLASARDIGDRVAAEAALREAYEALERRVEERTAALAASNAALAEAAAEQARARAALAQREEHFRRLIEESNDYVMIVDTSGAITYVGSSVERMLGYTAEEMIGSRPVDQVHPDDVPRVMETIAHHVANPGVTTHLRYRIRHKDGRWRWIENVGRTVSPHTAADGLVANCRDITERVEAEDALARAKEEAERANRAKSEFLSRMSHELRTPMNSILGFGQLLARADLPPQHAKSTQHIVKAGRHLLRLINEVLEIARIEAGRENLSLEPVALAPVLREALGLVRPVAQQHGVALHEEDADGEPWPGDAFVRADRQRLVQVLLNLLSNAIKYNRPGGHVRATMEPAGAGRWVVRVEDTGRGVPADRVGELFMPFARLGAEQTEVEGTGLGLALSRRLCEAMGGALALESSGPTGSVFRVELEGGESPLRQLEDTGTHALPAAPHRDATLLYVEDNLANLNLVETILLSRPGWRTVPALQGQLGVELAREHLPDVVLLDLHLPDIPGEEVLRRLRADPRTAGIPIVVVSADATAASLARLRQAGADAFLTKPLDIDEFLTVVERFLAGAPGG